METCLIYNMLYLVRKEDWQLLNITNWETLQLKYLVKFAKMYLSSPYLNYWRGKNFLNLQIQSTKQEQMCQLEGCGLTDKQPFVT